MSLKRKPRNLAFDLFDNNCVNSILDLYSIGKVKKISNIIFEGNAITLLNEKSQTSKKNVIETETGFYFIKQIPWYCDDERQIKFSHRLIEHLRYKNIPIPRLIYGKDGRSFYSINNCKFEIREFVSGELYQYSFEQIKGAGKILACLHKATTEFLIEPTDPQATLADVINEHINLIRDIHNISNKTSLFLDQIHDFFETYISPIFVEKKFPVHGDFIPWNMGFKKGEVIAIYDFDNAVVDSRLHDIAEAIVSFFVLKFDGHSSRLIRKQPLTFDFKETLVFLSEYERFFPLSIEEHKALPYYIIGNIWECILLAYIKNELDEEDIWESMNIPKEILSLFK